MINHDYLTISELAKLLKISRVAVFKRIKKGQIKANKVGNIYLIPKEQLSDVLSTNLSEKLKKEIGRGVAKVVKEYGETLKLLGKE